MSDSIMQFTKSLNDQYQLDLPSFLPKVSPLLHLWQADIDIKTDNFLEDSAIRQLWESLKPSLDENQHIIYTARGDPASLAPFSDDMKFRLVFIVTERQ